MMKSAVILFLTLFLNFTFGYSVNNAECSNLSSSDRKLSFSLEKHKSKKPNMFFRLVKKKLERTKKITAALLAFPLPFGVLALHRIYLGTKPYVPVLYIGTFGGVLGILPFIDFCVLLLDKDIDRFYNNGKVFMWIR